MEERYQSIASRVPAEQEVQIPKVPTRRLSSSEK
jgi:hypothetical protein